MQRRARSLVSADLKAGRLPGTGALKASSVSASAAAGCASCTAFAAGRPELDLARPDTIAAVIAGLRPDLVVSAAAYTAVDRAEQEVHAVAARYPGAAALTGAAATGGAVLAAKSMFSAKARVGTGETGPTEAGA